MTDVIDPVKTQALTFRRYEDGDYKTIDWQAKIFDADHSHKCPTYIQSTPPCQGSCPAGEDIRGYIDYKKSYCVSDFKNDYNSLGGNAYGLANTLRQTAILKPSITNKKVKNLFYAGHLTVPGPGVPPAIISGNVAANQLLKYLETI